MKQENLLLILGMAVVTFIPRFIPTGYSGKHQSWPGIYPGRHLKRYCLSAHLFRRTRGFCSATSAPTFCHTCFCLWLESKKPLGISHAGNGSLLGFGICVLKGSRGQGFKGTSGITKLRKLTKDALLEPMPPRILEPFLDFFSDEAGDCFSFPPLPEIAFSVTKDSKSFE
jgi:hypothetical protein